MAEVVAVVHAKGTSTRVPGKNLRLLGDRPLFCWAVRAARAAEMVTAVYVDSESAEILQIGVDHGARPLRRPAALASNAVTGDDLARWQAGALPDADIVAQVVPTSPFLRPESIDGAVRLLVNSGADSVAGVRVEVGYWWVDGRPSYLRADGSIPNSTDLPPATRETAGLYVSRRSAVLRDGRRLPGRAIPFELSPIEAVDIDTEADFAFAEIIAAGLQQEPSTRRNDAQLHPVN